MKLQSILFIFIAILLMLHGEFSRETYISLQSFSRIFMVEGWPPRIGFDLF